MLKLVEKMVKIKKYERVTWTILVPQQLNALLEEHMRANTYKTKSEFIRTAVRDRLKQETQVLRTQDSER